MLLSQTLILSSQKLEFDNDFGGDNTQQIKRRRRSSSNNPRHPEVSSTGAEKFKWVEGGHGSSCAACGDGGELICCEICPGAYHIGCAVPPLSCIPVGDWFCPQCDESGASRSKFMDGEDVSSEHLKKWIMIFKARWRTAIVLEVPTVPGEFLVKWWRHDDRGGKVARVNVEGTKILILPDDIQAALNEKTKKIRLDVSTTLLRALLCPEETPGAYRGCLALETNILVDVNDVLMRTATKQVVTTMQRNSV